MLHSLTAVIDTVSYVCCLLDDIPDSKSYDTQSNLSVVFKHSFPLQSAVDCAAMGGAVAG